VVELSTENASEFIFYANYLVSRGVDEKLAPERSESIVFYYFLQVFFIFGPLKSGFKKPYELIKPILLPVFYRLLMIVSSIHSFHGLKIGNC
jgi:hypothetical protein